LPRLSCSVHQLPFSCLPGFYIQPRNHLPTGMEITTYNDHLKAPFFPVVFVKQRILCWTGPSLLSNQSFATESRAGVALAWAQSQRVGDNYSPTLTGPSSPNQ
jgi:hypothetical protein